MKNNLLSPAAAGSALCLLCLLAGCAAGPDFRRPEAPDATGYTLAAQARGEAVPALVPGQAVDAEWWTAFRSPALNALVVQALAANPGIDAAKAALRQAQENVEAQRGLFFPTISAAYSPSRTKVSGNTAGANAPGPQGDGTVIAPTSAGAPVIYNFHTAQLNVGFVPDVFGGNRRQVEALEAQAETQRYALEAAKVTLAANVVGAAIQEAALRAQLDAVTRLVDINERALAILRRQQAAGYASALDVANQENLAAQAAQWLPPLRRQLEQTRDLIRILAGKRPDQDVAQTLDFATLQLPDRLPLTLPAQLVRQRPDVLAAETQLHAAYAQVGVAVAARLPQFSLTAAMGGEAAHFDQMFQASGKFFSVVGAVSATLFDGGALRHRQRAAEEGVALAEAQYRSTVLAAFQNVADTLHALDADAASVAASARAERAAQRGFDLVSKQHAQGYVDTLALINAEQALRQAAVAGIQAKAQHLGDSAALFQALGGGWQTAEASASPAPGSP